MIPGLYLSSKYYKACSSNRLISMSSKAAAALQHVPLTLAARLYLLNVGGILNP